MKYSFLILSFFFALETKAQFEDSSVQTEETEEVSYDDLINELSAKKQQAQPRYTSSAFDQIQIHGGMGLVNSFSTFRIQDKNQSRYQNGMQLSMGVDLFSKNWLTEVSWRNFGLTENGQEEHTLKEFGLKLGYKDHLEGPWSYRLQSGLAQRELKLTDHLRGIRIETSTPAMIASAGAMVEISPSASLNFEAGGRAPIIDTSADKGSLDFGIELRLSL